MYLLDYEESHINSSICYFNEKTIVFLKYEPNTKLKYGIE